VGKESPRDGRETREVRWLFATRVRKHAVDVKMVHKAKSLKYFVGSVGESYTVVPIMLVKVALCHQTCYAMYLICHKHVRCFLAFHFLAVGRLAGREID
jgi:hypothetical protein